MDERAVQAQRTTKKRLLAQTQAIDSSPKIGVKSM
jgi:hypothetical protein